MDYISISILRTLLITQVFMGTSTILEVLIITLIVIGTKAVLTI
jgi:hypothetical protein